MWEKIDFWSSVASRAIAIGGGLAPAPVPDGVAAGSQAASQGATSSTAV